MNGPAIIDAEFREKDRPEPARIRLGKRLSFELCKLTIGAGIAAYALNGCYHGAAWSLRAADNAKRVLRAALAPQDGIVMALDSGEDLEGELDSGDLNALIADSAHTYGIDPAILHGIVHVESHGNPHAYNAHSGALGLGQLLPSTRRKLGLSDGEAKTPRHAIDAAAYWYRVKRDEEGGDDARAVQSYYCGPKCVGTKTGMGYLRKVAQSPTTPDILSAMREIPDSQNKHSKQG